MGALCKLYGGNLSVRVPRLCVFMHVEDFGHGDFVHDTGKALLSSVFAAVVVKQSFNE